MPDGNGDSLTLEWKPAGKQTATVTARLNGDALACETFNLTKGKEREAFARAVTSGRPGIDTQAVLPRGSTTEVSREVKRRLDDLAPGGGYVLAPVHDVQPEVPPANLCGMFDAADEWGDHAAG